MSIDVCTGGCVEVLKSFEYVMEKSLNEQSVLPPLIPNRWLATEDLRVESHMRVSKESKSGVKSQSESEVFADQDISRLINDISEKLRVDCASVLRKGDAAMLKYRSAK